MLTLAEAESILSPYVGAGLDFTDRLNAVCRVLMQAGNWRGTKNEVIFNVFPDANGQAIITLPRYFNTILAMARFPSQNCTPPNQRIGRALKIRNGWYEYYSEGPGFTRNQTMEWSRQLVSMNGRYTTFLDWNSSTPMFLYAETETTESIAAQIIFKGFSNGQKIYSMINGVWSEGVALNLGGTTNTANLFSTAMVQGQNTVTVDVTAGQFTAAPNHLLAFVVKPSTGADDIGAIDAIALSATSVQVTFTALVNAAGYNVILFAQQTNSSTPLAPNMFSANVPTGQLYVDVDVTSGSFSSPPGQLLAFVTAPSGQSSIRVLSAYPTSETSVRVFLSATASVSGYTVTLFAAVAQNGNQTVQSFDFPPYAVVKSSTNGRVFLYAVDGSGNKTLAAIYEPTETGIAWPRYKVPACINWTSENPGQYVGICKRAFVPAKFSYDEIIPSNLQALTLALQSFAARDANDLDRADKFWWGDKRTHQQGALSVLEQEEEDDIGPSAEGIIQMQDDFHIARVSYGV